MRLATSARGRIRLMPAVRIVLYGPHSRALVADGGLTATDRKISPPRKSRPVFQPRLVTNIEHKPLTPIIRYCWMAFSSG